jgi:hypothetical protein
MIGIRIKLYPNLVPNAFGLRVIAANRAHLKALPPAQFRNIMLLVHQ